MANTSDMYSRYPTREALYRAAEKRGYEVERWSGAIDGEYAISVHIPFGGGSLYYVSTDLIHWKRG